MLSKLPKCHLCPDGSDPRMTLHAPSGASYPLCDGCSPDCNEESIRAVYARCQDAGPGYSREGRPRFGFAVPESPLPGTGQQVKP